MRILGFEINHTFPDEKSRWPFSSLVSLMLVFGAGALALFEKEQHKFIILAVRHPSQGTSISNKYKRKVIITVKSKSKRHTPILKEKPFFLDWFLL